MKINEVECLNENELIEIESKTGLLPFEIKSRFIDFSKQFGFILKGDIDNRERFLDTFSCFAKNGGEILSISKNPLPAPHF